MTIISIGYGRSLFAADDPERLRLRTCAEVAGNVHHIVFARRTDGLKQEVVGASLHLYPTQSRTRAGMFFDALRVGSAIIKAEKGPVVITAQDPLLAGLVAYFLARRYRLPLVLQEHADIFAGDHWRCESFKNRCLFPIARFLIRRADRVRVVASRVARHVEGVGVDPARIRKLAVFSHVQQTTTTNSELNLRTRHPGAFIVLSVARFVPQKNLPLLLHAFVKLHEVVPQAVLVLVGRGPLEEALKREAEQLKITDAVHFMPWAKQVGALMQSADLYALSSNYEGWARVLPEAMASGLPAVTTDVGCVGEVFLDGRHGAVVPVGDTEAFAQALIALANDDVRRTTYQETARIDGGHASSTIEAYARAWTEVYQGL